MPVYLMGCMNLGEKRVTLFNNIQCILYAPQFQRRSCIKMLLPSDLAFRVCNNLGENAYVIRPKG